MAQGQSSRASSALTRLLRRDPPYPASPELKPPVTTPQSGPSGYRALFSAHHRRATVFASLPWFLQDLGTYGIGIFTPTILATTLGHSVVTSGSVAQIIHGEMDAARGTAVIDLLLIVGIVFAVLFSDKVGRIKL